jgi:hypothetical protein
LPLSCCSTRSLPLLLDIAQCTALITHPCLLSRSTTRTTQGKRIRMTCVDVVGTHPALCFCSLLSTLLYVLRYLLSALYTHLSLDVKLLPGQCSHCPFRCAFTLSSCTSRLCAQVISLPLAPVRVRCTCTLGPSLPTLHASMPSSTLVCACACTYACACACDCLCLCLRL